MLCAWLGGFESISVSQLQQKCSQPTLLSYEPNKSCKAILSSTTVNDSQGGRAMRVCKSEQGQQSGPSGY
jgi:hypothetical protein